MLVCALLIIIGLFTPYVNTLDCATNNPCHLDPIGGDFSEANGYKCFDLVATNNVVCVCPNGRTQVGGPCRICDLKPLADFCGPTAEHCLEFNFGPGKPYACVCGGSVQTPVIGGNCLSKCDNQGVRDPTTNLCNCPSGFTGSMCEIPIASKLCDNIQCMSNGVCAIRAVVPGASIYQSKCLCPKGSDGQYCEQPNISGSCATPYCVHGTCQPRTIGNSDYIYCQCKPGWSGARCALKTFSCPSPGYFVDELMKSQGKYFLCMPFGTDYTLQQLTCPKGLKFNLAKHLCLQ